MSILRSFFTELSSSNSFSDDIDIIFDNSVSHCPVSETEQAVHPRPVSPRFDSRSRPSSMTNCAMPRRLDSVPDSLDQLSIEATNKRVSL
jgi:hypothetical protein